MRTSTIHFYNHISFLSLLTLIYAPILLLGHSYRYPASICGILLLSCFMLYWTVKAELPAVVRCQFQELRLFFLCLFLVISTQWILLAWVNYYSFYYHTWDTASFANTLSNLTQRGKFYNTFLERHALADHFTPNMILFYPFFIFQKTTMWLTMAKIGAFLACPLLLIQTGKLIKLPGQLLYIAPILFLFHHYTANTMLFEFQPSSLSMPFILLTFNSAMKRNYLLTTLFLLFLIGFKEHMSLIWISVGVYILCFQKEKRTGLSFIGIGLIMGLIIFFMVMPYFADGLPSLHSSRFNPCSLYVEKGRMIFLSLCSVGLIPLIRPTTLLFILPAFGISLVANNLNMVTFHYHYHDIAMVVLFVGVVVGLSGIETMGKKLNHKVSSFSLMVIILILIIMNRTFPSQTIRDHWPDHRDFEIVTEIDVIRDLLDRETTVWTTERFTAMLMDHVLLKSIDIWGGSEAVQTALGKKTILIPKDPVLASLGHEKYKKLVKRLEEDVSKKISSKNNSFHHFALYFYEPLKRE